MNAIASVDQSQLVVRESAIDRMLAVALDQNADLDRLEQLYEMKQKYEADEARKAFVAALAEFKTEPLRITKDKHVKFTTQRGVTEYDHATIGNVVNVIVPALAKHGFSHAWALMQDNGKLTVTCRLTHRQGHSESVQMTASPDDSGGKNAIQSIASTKSYLERYTLLAITGLATEDSFDDDGQTSERSPEEIASADEAAKFVQSWLDAIAGCADETELAARKKELVKSCGGVAKVPQDLIDACVERKAALAGTK
jgi:hypothetical protein